MHTRFFTSVKLRFNPFDLRGKTPRLFAALLPPDARAQGMKIQTEVLPRNDRSGGFVEVVFTDGDKYAVQTKNVGIKDVVEEVERRTRLMARKEELAS
ncbi:hypothetical protein EX30DRAFT_336717 [Ascodesmis nigricans]|uniref:Large ribosomal subunit protein mL53 n=1 Tax=Ascodesmis nigricans TaxID=341454 RepID=A0A4S2MHK5_9PEZI|nr:hypothetical protein EX30DRAFT_336717 [Ascodesmis nigricans]